MKTVMQLTDEILNASPEAQQVTAAHEEAPLPEMSDEQRNSMLGLTESNARITAKKAMRGEPPSNARDKRAVRAKLDKSPSKANKVGLDVAAAAYESIRVEPDKKFQSMDDALNPLYTRDTNEATDSPPDPEGTDMGTRTRLTPKEQERQKQARIQATIARHNARKAAKKAKPPQPEEAGMNDWLTAEEANILKEAVSIMKRLNENSKKGYNKAVSSKIKKLKDEGKPQDQAVAIALNMKKVKSENTSCGSLGVGVLKPVKTKVTLLKSNKKKKANESFKGFLDNILNEVKSN